MHRSPIILIHRSKDNRISFSSLQFPKGRGENLMQAHRSHLYQYLSNELKLPHWKVTLLYAVVKLSQYDETKTY